MKLLNIYSIRLVFAFFFLFLRTFGATEPSSATITLTQPSVQLFGEKVPQHFTLYIENKNDNNNNNNNKNNPSQGNISNATQSSSDTSVAQAARTQQATSQSVSQVATQTSTQTTDVRLKQVLTSKIKSTFSSISMDYYKARMHNAYVASTQWFSDHRYHLLLAAGLISYATLCYLAHRGFNYFKNTSGWGSWKRELSLERLLSIPQDEITRELIITIQTRYINQQNPTDCIQPLMNFTRDLEQEINTLRWYKKYFLFLDRFYLSRITFIKADYVIEIQKKLERLAYIKQVFGQWLAQQNLMHIFDQPQNRSFYQQVVRSVKNAVRSSTDTISRSYRSLRGNIESTNI